MRFIFQLFAVFSVAACTSLSSTTGYPGIGYGDSYKKVLANLEKNSEIIEHSESRIVALGVWEVTKDCRRIVFTFFDDEGLQQVSYEPVGETSNVDPCK